jgi:uncharacterized protein (TIGR03790 family)
LPHPRPPAALLGLLLAVLPPLVLALRCGGGGPVVNDHVLVVVNANSQISIDIGEYYRMRRNIPVSNVLALDVPLFDPGLGSAPDQNLTRAKFEEDIRDPIADFLVLNDIDGQIRYIVIVKGIPYRIAGTGSSLSTWTRASVESELSILFSGLDGAAGPLPNPYFESDLTFEDFLAENPGSPLRFLVARLDGSQQNLDPGTGVPADVKSLIDGAFGSVGSGTWLIDEDPVAQPGFAGGNVVLLGAAAAVLEAVGLDVTHDTSAVFQSDVASLRGYASWGSNDTNDAGSPYYGSIGGKLYPGTFLPRAVSVDIVSSNGSTFTAPLPHVQSLVADLIHLGASGAAAHAFEPWLNALARPHILLRLLAQGRPAGEAFHRSIPYLSWQNFYVGDPLMTGWGATVDPDDLDGDGVLDANDNCTDLPNPDQRDTDADGYGNRCDGDVDDDGVVTSCECNCATPPHLRGDLEQILCGGYDPHHDLDGDADVDDADVSIASMRLLHPPGPSGLAP